MTATTYCYCLVQSPRPPALTAAPPGLPGLERPRGVAAGRALWLVVADAPRSRYGPESIERRLSDLRWVSACAMAHDAVVAHCARLGTVLPMKLFTLFSSDARAVADIARRRGRLMRLLGRLAGRQEWGLQLTADRPAPRVTARRAARAGKGRVASGTAYLLARRRERDEAARQVAGARQEGERLLAALARHADDARRHPVGPAPDGSRRLLLDAALLVRADRTGPFRAAAARLAGRLGRQGYRVRLTGPWPPYNFVDRRM